MTRDDLIFDLGFHNGDDSHYYMSKGYTVVAIEANPFLVEVGQQRFAEEIGNGHLILLNKAISPEKEKVPFYIHPSNSDWSSCHSNIAGSDGSELLRIIVPGTTLHQLYEAYGVPHYLKVDVEGSDVFVAKEMSEYHTKPEYISFETSRHDYAGIFSYLYVAGYKMFQLVNQVNNEMLKSYVKTLEGVSIEYIFTKYSSGLFGTDLPADRWYPFEEVLSRYMKYKELKQIDNKELGLGWVDIHARYSD